MRAMEDRAGSGGSLRAAVSAFVQFPLRDKIKFLRVTLSAFNSFGPSIVY